MKARTYGEERLGTLLRELPRDEFFCYAEPRIDDPTKGHRYPDFVIIWRSKGVICLEVKDWRFFEAYEQQRIRVRNSGGTYRTERNPFEIARDYSYNLMNVLERRRELLNGDRRGLPFPVEGLALLTHQPREKIKALTNSNIFPRNKVLCAEDLVDSSTLLAALKRMTWTFQLSKPLEDAHIHFIEKTLAVLEIRSGLDSGNEKRGELTEDQERIIYAPLPARESGVSKVVVRGVAGSGKSIVISKRAQVLSEANPDIQILVTAFSQDLLEDLKRRIGPCRNIKIAKFFDLVKETLGNDYPQYHEYRKEMGPRPVKHWCEENYENDKSFLMPIDFIAQEISRRKELDLVNDEAYNKDLEKRGSDLTTEEFEEICLIYEMYLQYQAERKDSGESYMDFEDTCELATRKMCGSTNSLGKRFDVVMVDEGQDLSKRMLDLLRSTLKPGGCLFVCDDPLQTLWREYDTEDRRLKGADFHYLRAQLRTTREVSELAQSLLDIVPDISSDDSEELYPTKTLNLSSGPIPKLIQYADLQEEEERVLQAVKIKVDAGTLPSRIAVLTPQTTKSFKHQVKELGAYWGNFNLMKGLEFDVVFIAKLDELFFSKWNERVLMRRMLYRKFFVAITRARSELYLSHTQPLPERFVPLSEFCSSALASCFAVKLKKH